MIAILLSQQDQHVQNPQLLLELNYIIRISTEWIRDNPKVLINTFKILDL